MKVDTRVRKFIHGDAAKEITHALQAGRARTLLTLPKS